MRRHLRKVSEINSDLGSDGGVVAQQSNVGGEALTGGELGDASEEKGRDLFAADLSGLGVGEGSGDGGLDRG